MKKKLIVLLVILVVIDQLSKWLAQTRLVFHQEVDVLPFFALYLTYNEGIAFSWLAWMGRAGLIVMTLCIIAFMLYLWRKLPPNQQLASVGFCLVIAGAVGNLIDRITQGHVIDFFLFHTETWAFAVFNVADSFITLGAICIILEEVNAVMKKPKTDKQPSD